MEINVVITIFVREVEDPDLRRLSLISKQRNHIETYTYFSSSVKTKCVFVVPRE